MTEPTRESTDSFRSLEDAHLLEEEELTVGRPRELLDHDEEDGEDVQGSNNNSSIYLRLYLSHFLSTWNTRVFEFGATLFLANIFPGTLLPMSIYALVRAAAAMILSPTVGMYIDMHDRLKVVRLSIVIERVSVACSCVTFFFLMRLSTISDTLRFTSIAFLSLLACFEKLAAIMNRVAVGRDWIVTIANGDKDTLTILNARMRRIDLVCKVGGPLLAAIVDSSSPQIAVLMVLCLTLLSIGVEYLAIAQVYRLVPALHKLARFNATNTKQPQSVHALLREFPSTYLSSIKSYFHHPVMLPSFALSLLYLTVLSFAAHMITYLLSAGLTPLSVGLARTASALVELSATLLAPILMTRIGPLRTGAWSVNWQIVCLVLGVFTFWNGATPPIAAWCLIAGVVCSRLGLFGFDLSVQLIIQQEVEEGARGSFSTVEASLQNAFSLLSYLATIIFSRPEEFRYPTAISLAATIAAGVAYAVFVRRRRGHLLHLPAFMSTHHHHSEGSRGWAAVPQDEHDEDEI